MKTLPDAICSKQVPDTAVCRSVFIVIMMYVYETQAQVLAQRQVHALSASCMQCQRNFVFAVRCRWVVQCLGNYGLRRISACGARQADWHMRRNADENDRCVRMQDKTHLRRMRRLPGSADVWKRAPFSLKVIYTDGMEASVIWVHAVYLRDMIKLPGFTQSLDVRQRFELFTVIAGADYWCCGQRTVSNRCTLSCSDRWESRLIEGKSRV